MKKLYWIIAIAILCVSSNAFAFRLRTTPVNTELFLDPGKNAREVIEVRNEGSRSVGLRVNATGHLVDEKGKVRSGSDQFTAEKWISITPSKFVLNPNDYGVIRFEVKVPEASAPGTYGADIMILQNPDLVPKEGGSDTSSKSAGIRVLGAIAHLVTVNVGKPTGYNVKLESFGLNKEKTDFLITTRNLGNFQYPYEGEIKIFSEDKKIKEIRVSALMVWPKSVKTIKVKMPKGLSSGTYSAELNIGGKKQGSLNAKSSFTISS